MYSKLKLLVATQNKILQAYAYDEEKAMKDVSFLTAKKEADAIVSMLQKAEGEKIIHDSYLFSNETTPN